jgi:tetratricopeptide (TPR) repeat protein
MARAMLNSTRTTLWGQDHIGPLPQQHVVSMGRDGEIVSDTRVTRRVTDGLLSETRWDQAASHQQVAVPPWAAQPPQAAQALQFERIEDFLGANVASLPAASQSIETTSIAAKRAAFLEKQQQPSTGLRKARSKALAQKGMQHADILAAADAITGDRVIALQTIVKYVQNAHKEAKYRSVKSSSKALQERVLNNGGGPLLIAAGFTDYGETWQFSSEAKPELLRTLASLLEAAQKPPPTNTPFGKTYSQLSDDKNPKYVHFLMPLLGRAVLHFSSLEESYIMFGVEQGTPIINNLKVQSYDSATRTLHGSYVPTTCNCGSCGWSLELIFSTDFKAICSGSIFKTKNGHTHAINLVSPLSTNKGARFVEADGIPVVKDEFEVAAALDRGKLLAAEGDSLAGTVLQEGLEQAQRVGAVSAGLRSRLHTALACVHNFQGQYIDAVYHFEAALALGNSDGTAMFHVGFGVALLGADRPTDAITHLETARHSAGLTVLGVTVTNHIVSACALAILGAAYLALGEMDSAIATLEATLPHMASITSGSATPERKFGSQEMEVYIRMKLGRAYECLGRLADSEAQETAVCQLLSNAPTLSPDASPNFVSRACLTGRL